MYHLIMCCPPGGITICEILVYWIITRGIFKKIPYDHMVIYFQNCYEHIAVIIRNFTFLHNVDMAGTQRYVIVFIIPRMLIIISLLGN